VDVTQRSLTIYELARMDYLAYAIGQPQPIADRDLVEYRQRMERSPRRFDRSGTTGEPSGWRCQKRLLERWTS
jgi:hypothetical protein